MSECHITKILLEFKNDTTRSALPKAEAKIRRLMDFARQEAYEEAMWDKSEEVRINE